MIKREIHSCPELTALVEEVGFLPLLNVGIAGWSAEDMADDDCRYHVLPEGGFEWPLWAWKGSVLRESGCAYGKMILKKACFISRAWWPHFCNYRRSLYPAPQEGSIEEAIIETLRTEGSMITRNLRRACGFTGTKERSKFDAYISRLQMACRIVTEDFVYPTDRHGHEYGWGLALLTLPEQRFGREGCKADCTPRESYERIRQHFRAMLPEVDEKVIGPYPTPRSV